MIGKIAIGAAAITVTALVGVVVHQTLKINSHDIGDDKIKIGFNDDGTCYFTQSTFETSRNRKDFKDKLYGEGDNPCQLLLEGKLDFNKVTWINSKGIESENAKKYLSKNKVAISSSNQIL